jgi:SP family general alpha glucoside:H+ symporter-like MFS transporter
MEGYDTLLLGQFYAQPAFAKRFGELNPANNVYEIPTRWQTALGVSTQIGNILGLQLTGVLSERFGYRITMLVALIALTGFLFIQFFAVNLPMLLVGYLLLGFPWGTFQTMTVSYAAEVMPVRLRQYLTTYVNLCWVIGQIISSGVNRALVGNNTQWAYKIPFALQWMWCLPIGLGIAFAPESPWWLVKKGRFPEAEKCLMRLTARDSGFTEDDAKKTVAMMDHTNQLEIAQHEGVAFKHCFQGINLRRTEIACFTWLTQNTCGSALMGNATYFLK